MKEVYLMKMTKKQYYAAAAIMAVLAIIAVICGVMRNSVPSAQISDDIVVADTVAPAAPAVPSAPDPVPSIPASAQNVVPSATVSDIGVADVVVIGPDCGADYYEVPTQTATPTVTVSVPATPDFVDDCGIVDEESDAPAAPSSEAEWEAIYGFDYSSRNDDTPEVPLPIEEGTEEILHIEGTEEPSEVPPMGDAEVCEDTPDAAPTEEESFFYEEDDSEVEVVEEFFYEEDTPDEAPAEASAEVEDVPDVAPEAPAEAPAAEAAPAVDATPVVETAPAVEAAPTVDVVVEAAPAVDTTAEAVAW